MARDEIDFDTPALSYLHLTLMSNLCSLSYSLPEDGWFGASLDRPIPVVGPKRVFGHIFTDVPGSKRQPQHGRQRSVVKHDANLTQIKMETDITKGSMSSN